MKRIFVVGCPRSGTTLVQTILMSTRRLVSFQESHFFPGLDAQGYGLRPPGLVAKRLVDEWLTRSGASWKRRPKLPLTTRQGVSYFCETLDSVAESQGALGWVEKTPRHLHHIRKIRTHIPDAMFIHVIRDPMQNISSLHRARKMWGDSASAVDSARYWFRFTSRSLSYLGVEGHLHLKYEDLLEQPLATVKRLSGFLGLSVPDPTEVDLRGSALSVISPAEEWKAQNVKERGLAHKVGPLDLAFSEAEEAEILGYLKSVKDSLDSMLL